ncbi:MAG: FtsW/RodA/SpoVE family cell cycle protein [Paludibacteraceae bacterium]|nr:FtsW/RodA/SpoVE family cell cycle protein [Paludibacteraceae bacterium]
MGNKRNFTSLFKGDKTIWVLLFFLSAVSIIALYSAGSELVFSKKYSVSPILKHTLFLIIGIGLCIWVSHGNVYRIRMYVYGLLALGIVLQLLTFTGLGVKINGARRWIRLPLIGLTFQPSELIKLFLVMVVADLLTHIKDEESLWLYFKIIIGLSGFCAAIILPSNLSTAILVFFITLTMLFIAQIPGKWLLMTIATLMIVAVTGYGLVKIIPRGSVPEMFERVYTWESRIDQFIQGKNKDNVSDEDKKNNYQILMGKTAIANGRFLGQGIGKSQMKNVLPLAFADSIFAIIVEETGVWGMTFIILLYLALLFRAGHIARRSDKQFTQMAVMGLALTLVLQAVISMLVVVDFGPTTGQPLPLISHGGTSVIATCLYFGFLLAFDRDMMESRAKDEQVRTESENDVPVVDLEEQVTNP